MHVTCGALPTELHALGCLAAAFIQLWSKSAPVGLDSIRGGMIGVLDVRHACVVGLGDERLLLVGPLTWRRICGRHVVGFVFAHRSEPSYSGSHEM